VETYQLSTGLDLAHLDRSLELVGDASLETEAHLTLVERTAEEADLVTLEKELILRSELFGDRDCDLPTLPTVLHLYIGN
jgi:hypothetical protein